MTLRRIAGRAALLGFAALAPLGLAAQQLAPEPEGATGRRSVAPGTASRFMVAAANPLAADAGREILRAGGSAVDAAIAVQLVVALVEPQSSGLGGGAFLVAFDAASRSVTSLDGRETAPAAATPDRFLRPDGKPMEFMQAVVGGRSVGVSGTPRLLETAHRRFGKLPWRRLFEPAIRLSESGFRVSPRLNGLLAREIALRGDPLARPFFYEPDGSPKPVGTLVTNPALAATLRTLAENGADAFYDGPIAQDIVARVTGHPTNPGDMTLGDLKAYAVSERPAVCGTYRAFRLCGMGPPSSGAVAILQILAVMERQDVARMGPGAEAAHWFAEGGRLAFADRARYLADPAYVDVPVRGLTDRGYLESRAALAGERSMGRATPGEPPFRKAGRLAPSEGLERGTSHISVVDAEGNAVALTTTIEDQFGARIMTGGGFLLNNELTDFSFVPALDGVPVANRVEGGKRPRSSMSPTIVFGPDGRLRAVVGSAGGSQIIPYVAKTLVAILDWHMDPQAAVDFPNFGNRNGPTELEAGTEAEGWRAALEARGHQVVLAPMTSGTQAIVVTPDGLVGGADSRREGVAVGD